MTLLFQYGYRDDFVLMTSDTRKRMKYYDGESLEENGRYGEPIETKEKIFKVSNFVNGSVGGILSFSQEASKRLVERVKENDYLDQCKGILEEIAGEINQERKEDAFFQKHHGKGSYGLYLTGYYEDGSIGLVGLEGNKVHELRSRQGFHYMFSPTKEINNMVEQIFDFTHDPVVNNNHLDTVVNALADRQAKISFLHPEVVSSTFLYMGFIKYPDGIRPFQGEWDLSEYVKQLQGAE